MKLRIRGNSIRLRIQQQEVKLLLDEGRVTEQTLVGSRVFYYGIESNVSAKELTANFDGEGIRIIVPPKTLEEWCRSEELSLYSEQSSRGEILKILVEKDLKCIKPRTSPMWEDESDAYPNPNTSCGGA